MRMLALAQGDWLGAELLSPRVVRDTVGDEPAGGLKERVEQLEARMIKETLIRLRWNKSQAADELGLSRVGLRAKLARYGLERRE